jgi:hypothetical protein
MIRGEFEVQTTSEFFLNFLGFSMIFEKIGSNILD